VTIETPFRPDPPEGRAPRRASPKASPLGGGAEPRAACPYKASMASTTFWTRPSTVAFGTPVGATIDTATIIVSAISRNTYSYLSQTACCPSGVVIEQPSRPLDCFAPLAMTAAPLSAMTPRSPFRTPPPASAMIDPAARRQPRQMRARPPGIHTAR